MTAIRLRKFGRSLVVLSEDRTTIARWADLLGDELAAVEPFLAKAGTAARIRLRGSDGHEQSLRVVRHDKADLVGVNDDTGERVDLTFDQAQLHAVDWKQLIDALRAGLGLTGTVRTIPDASRTWEIGRMPLTDQRSASIFLVGAPRDQIASAMDRIAAEGVKDAVVLVGDAAMSDAEAVARLAHRQVLVAGLRDHIAIDPRGRLIGIGGPECILGDLRALLGLAAVSKPAYQFVRAGARWDLVFRGKDIAVTDSNGMRAIAMLLDKPDVPLDATHMQATIHREKKHLLQGSSGVVNDRRSRQEYAIQYKKLKEQLDRLGTNHPEADRIENEMDMISEEIAAGDGFGGEDKQVTVGARAGRAIGGAINRAIDEIDKQGEHGRALAAYLRDTLKNPTGQHPVYKPPVQIPWEFVL